MSLEHFHPTIGRWFATRFGEPTEPQREGWRRIRSGRHTLISAPTGTGKTIAGYLWAIDGLAKQGAALADKTEVLYISPLRALSNDVQKNLQGPLGELAEMDPEFPKIRVLVRTGDTPQRDRAAMLRKPPHILVTTPESLYILLTAKRGREMLSTVKTVIVDEIHALARDKRGSHLALSLERLETLVAPLDSPTSGAFQRIGLSATQKPLSEVGRFLVGAGRDCELVDVGHRRPMDVAIQVPPSPLSTVCSHEQWDEIYAQIAALDRSPSHHADFRQHAQARRAHHRAADRSAGRRAGHLPSQQPVERAPAGRGASAEIRQSARPGRHGFAGIGHRHRRRRSGRSKSARRARSQRSCSASAAPVMRSAKCRKAGSFR